MSQLKVRNALVNQLVTNTAYDVALENDEFKPKSDLYLAAFFIPVESQAMGKDSASSDELTGLFQVDVICKLNNSKKGLDQLSAVDEVSAIFKNNDQITLDGVTVYIKSKTNSGGSYQDGFYRAAVRVFYSAYVSR